MAGSKDLRKRITSVKNTQQITKAMKMVSAAKLRRAQENILKLRPYAFELNKVLSTLAQYTQSELTHPLLNIREKEKELKSVLVILITSDRGLCGSFNSNIIKTGQAFLREKAKNYKKIDFAFIGKRGNDYYKTRKPGKYYQDFFKGLVFQKAQTLSQELIDLYLKEEYDEIKFIYAEFKSALSQKINVETFLPVIEKENDVNIKGGNQHQAVSAITFYEPTANEILDALLPKHFATKVYKALLESSASEHGARMAAMENATKNAGEMMRKLTLLYNKTRQAGITKELLEITSGSEAQK